MNTERRRRALQIFDQVVELPPSEQSTALDELCAGDGPLRAQAAALLAADSRPGEPFRGNALHWGQALAVPGAGGLAADDPAPAGRTIGAWRIIEVIGRGGMGTVYRVERSDGSYRQQAALKLIRSASDSPAARERFLRERQTLARLKHPNIATLLDGGFAPDGDPYFVMEYIDGQPIDLYCSERSLDPRARIVLFLQVLDAVQYAHRNLVVHRDLKPSNLLVDAQGRVKLVDFGIAKELEGDAATVTGEHVLTFAYASPEQLRAAAITTATDVWQLGIALHRLLGGSHPFGLDPDMPAARQLELLGREPARLPQDPFGDLSDVVAGCLRREPESRYPSVEALADDLRRWLGHLPIRIVPPDRWTLTRAWLRRNRTLAAAAAVTGAALIIGAGVSLWQAHEARQQARIAGGQSANARATMRFLSDTLKAAAPEQALNTEVSVRQLLDHARAELDRSGAVEPQVRQPVQRMLGHLYASLDATAPAAQLFAAGIHDVQPRNRDEALALADDLVAYSDVLAALEQYPQSLETADRAVALRRKFAPGDPEQQLRALAHQTFAHVQKYGLDACTRQAEQALALARSMPAPPVDVVLDLYGDLGFAADARNDGARELAWSEAGLAFADQHDVAADSPLRATLLRFEVQALIALSRPNAAEPIIRRNIVAVEKTGGAGTSRLGVLYTTLAIVLNAQGRYRDSLAAAQRSEQLLPPAERGPRNAATVLVNQAFLQAQLGDYPQALKLAERGRAELDRAGVPADDPVRRDDEFVYARILLAAGNPGRAYELLERLRAEARRLDGADLLKYARLTAQLGKAARRRGEAERSRQLLDETRAALAQNGLSPDDPLYAGLWREEAALARLRGDLIGAERAQREALQRLAPGPNATDTAIARSELADILSARGDRSGAQQLLGNALPVLRAAVLPREVSRAAAEILAGTLAGTELPL